MSGRDATTPRFIRLPRVLVRAGVPVPRQPIADEHDVFIEATIVTGYGRGELCSASRMRQLTYARHLTMYALRHFADVAVADIARRFRRDHATVIAGIRRVELELRTRPETRGDVETMRARLVRLALESEAS